MKFWNLLGWAACLILVMVAVLALLNPAPTTEVSPGELPPPIPVFR